MKTEQAASQSTNIFYQVWLAGLGVIEMLRKKSGEIFHTLVKEGKAVETRHKAARGQAKENSLVEAVVATKEEYQKKLETQLREWDTQLDQLKVRAKEAQAGVRVRIEEELENLKGQRAALQGKLDELYARGENAWEDLKDGVEKAWADLGDAMAKVVAHFK